MLLIFKDTMGNGISIPFFRVKEIREISNKTAKICLDDDSEYGTQEKYDEINNKYNALASKYVGEIPKWETK